MTKTEVRAQWAELLARPDEDWELDRAALLLAAEEYPLLQIEPYLSLLDSFASRARVRDDLFADTQFLIPLYGIGCQQQTCAERFHLRGGFEYVRADSDFMQGDGRRESGNATAEDGVCFHFQ